MPTPIAQSPSKNSSIAVPATIMAPTMSTICCRATRWASHSSAAARVAVPLTASAMSSRASSSTSSTNTAASPATATVAPPRAPTAAGSRRRPVSGRQAPGDHEADRGAAQDADPSPDAQVAPVQVGEQHRRDHDEQPAEVAESLDGVRAQLRTADAGRRCVAGSRVSATGTRARSRIRAACASVMIPSVTQSLIWASSGARWRGTCRWLRRRVSGLAHGDLLLHLRPTAGRRTAARAEGRPPASSAAPRPALTGQRWYLDGVRAGLAVPHLAAHLAPPAAPHGSSRRDREPARGGVGAT